MNFLFIVFLLLLLLILLLFAVPVKVIFSLDSNDITAKITLLWLYPFFKASVVYEGGSPVLTLHVFNKAAYKRVLNIKGRRANMRSLYKTAVMKNLSDVDIQASYGLLDPSATGIACCIMCIIAQFVNADSFEQKPDFLADSEYVNLTAAAELNIGSALSDLIRAYIRGSTRRLSYQNK